MKNLGCCNSVVLLNALYTLKLVTATNLLITTIKLKLKTQKSVEQLL